ncbi:hypothetical protein K474DRAFT_1694180 [Panus rudis PR-1116 ss-1]|nr:hypothetical protein K474DRAFT_1694180 [Panus rudis PR-1116 ss-1]
MPIPFSGGPLAYLATTSLDADFALLLIMGAKKGDLAFQVTSHSDSETESESEFGTYTGDRQDGALGFLEATSPLDIVSNMPFRTSMTVEQACMTLMSVDIALVTVENVEIMENIRSCSQSIIAYFNRLASCDTAHEEAHIVGYLHSFLNVSFMERLFDLRSVFHDIAANNNGLAGSNRVVVCWVDTVFTKLGSVLPNLFFATGHIHPSHLESPLLVAHREQSLLFAAAQLPREWRLLGTTFSSTDHSPAASRTAVVLLFCVYVIGPRLGTTNVWNVGSLRPPDLLRSLQSYLYRIDSELDQSSIADARCSETEKMTYAMVVALFASCDAHDCSDPLKFRPHIQAIISKLMKITMQSVDAPRLTPRHILRPLTKLDPAQQILVYCDFVLSWCWQQWDDEDTVDYELIDYMSYQTSIWLYHVTQDSGPLKGDQHWINLVRTVTSRCTPSAACVISRLLHYTIAIHESQSTLSTEGLDVSYKLVRLATQLFHERSHEVATEQIIVICQTFVSLYLLLKDAPGETIVKDALIEGLLMPVTHDHLASVLKSVMSDARFNGSLKLEEVLIRLNKCVHENCGLLIRFHLGVTSRGMRADPCAFDTNLITCVRQALHFVVIMWHFQVTKIAHRHILSSFLKGVVTWVSSGTSAGMCPSVLLCPLVTALSLAERHCANNHAEEIYKLWDTQHIWELCLSSEPTDLLATATFALYITATANDFACPEDLLIDSWDHMQEALLPILQRRFLGDEESLGLLVCPSICCALIALLQRPSTPAWLVAALASSPWTQNVHHLVKKLAVESQNEYETTLSAQILPVALRLLEAVKPHSRQTTVNLSTPKLLACRISSTFHLLLVHEDV